MTSFAFELKNEHGLHARPAGYLVQTCGKFESRIEMVKDGKKYNCKSIMGILKMGGTKGDAIVIEVEGEDEHDALDAVKMLIDANFNE